MSPIRMNRMLCLVVLLGACLSVSSTEVVKDCLTTEQAEDCGECCKINYEDCSSDQTKDKRVVCYFTNWAWYRAGVGKFTPENIDPRLCTDIIYAFASLGTDNYTITMSDSWADLDNHFYANVTALRSQGVRVLCAIGGWNNSTAKWNVMMASQELRTRFVESVVDFLELYEFDGLDMDYEYPGCPQGVRSEDSLENAKNFNKLIEELREAFGDRYLLTLAASAGLATLTECYYDAGYLFQLFDFINIMGYDFKSHLDGEVSANAPFCGTGDSWGVYDTIRYYTDVLKCPADKLVLGVPLYGQTYTLADEDNHGWGAAITGAGEAGPITVNAGTLAYYEICQKISGGWIESFNRVNSSYAYYGNQSVSFDSIQALERKVCLIKKFGLGGVMIWELAYDDFTGDSCNCGKNPLLKTLNNKLLGTSYDVPCAK